MNVPKHLKEILAEEPVLNIVQNDAETEVHTDASIWDYGDIPSTKDLLTRITL